MRTRLQQKENDDEENLDKEREHSIDENIPYSLQVKLGMVVAAVKASERQVSTERETVKQRDQQQNQNPELVEGFHLGDRSALHEDRDSRKALLKQAAKSHLEHMVHQLVNRSLIIHSSEKKQWTEVVINLAENACKSVMPQVPLGDMMDIRPYVNVKAIPGGHVTESAYVTGVVARKQVVHKKMRRAIKEPRVMLLSGSLQFQRVEHQMTSLDTLLEQEKKYLEILVNLLGVFSHFIFPFP